MKRINSKTYAIALILGIFILAACNSGAEEPDSDTDSAASSEVSLSETYVFPGFGYSIDYPTGWTAETRDTFTVISELETDLRNAFQDDSPPAEGLGVSLEQRTMDFMHGIGLAEDASLEDLFEFNKDFFEWQEPIELIEAEVFDTAALGARTSGEDDWSYILMGFTDDRAFLLQFTAPSEEALDDMMPTWEEMLASTQPAEE